MIFLIDTNREKVKVNLGELNSHWKPAFRSQAKTNVHSSESEGDVEKGHDEDGGAEYAADGT
mgnify:CR=1 FL=1